MLCASVHAQALNGRQIHGVMMVGNLRHVVEPAVCRLLGVLLPSGQLYLLYKLTALIAATLDATG